ncbi:HAD family hydrolase [Fulvivirga sp. 29W222]|uniref:HAD family hydrolase n=1 Tax=Fulvivirga marina TaxID=2494733 RepID=A0A937G5P7_9BACT|nr:HAD family hydrolase [Fulvivirga marina]MBL6448901.1 HAD family hydrolase [Fulvivirga marina]
MRRLVLFDFDGTLTSGDTFIEFIKFYSGTLRFYLGFLLLSPVLVLFKLKIIPNWRAKEYVLTYFFKGEHLNKFNEKGRSFAEIVVPNMIRKKAIDKFNKHREQGDLVIIVSASAVNWVKPWADQQGVDLIATNLEIENDRLTGRIRGRNCYGPEKVSRISQQIDTHDYLEVYVYGDSRGDREMLELATHPFYKKF